MYEYTHSHLCYDQIIIDDEPTKPVTNTTIQRNIRRYKPFEIEKSNNNRTTKAITEESVKHQQVNIEQQYGNIKQQQQLNPETYEFQQSISQPVSDRQQQSIIYTSDFELYQEQKQDSLKTQNKTRTKLQHLNLGQITKTRRAHNYSAVLPKIGKIHAQDKGHSIDRYHKEESLQYFCKSTEQLRQENKKLVRNIEQMRKMLPAAKKNIDLINQQSSQIRQMKFKQSKFFDVNYQLCLQKHVDNNSIKIEVASDRIKQVESMIKFRNKFKRRKQVKANRIQQILLEQEDQQSIQHEYSRVREDVLYQKREQQNHNKRVEQLNQKIAQYEQIIAELDQRAQIGQHEDLKRHKIVIQYDIQMIKTKTSSEETKLMLQIAQLNNSNSEIEVKLSKINSQLASILIQNNNNNNSNNNNSSNNKKLEISKVEVPTPQRNMNKIIRLFGRRS